MLAGTASDRRVYEGLGGRSPNRKGDERLISVQQRLMEASHAPRRTVKFCNRCGGTHSGLCSLVATSHGTRVRPDLLETVESRFREQLEEAA